MPAKYFICPDNERIEIEKCLSFKGCRMTERCATLPYLRVASYDREYTGITPSMAGTGARQIYLKATCDYAINPNDRAFSVLGIGTHNKLSIHRYTNNVLSEEKLSDEDSKGIADVLEQDEWNDGYYILNDYKTWGSYKVALALGLVYNDVPVFDDYGNPILYVKGNKKGKQKTTKEATIDSSNADLFSEEMQINRYRIFFEREGFLISKMNVFSLPRDGSTHIAKYRCIDKNIYTIPIKHINDNIVLEYYKVKQESVDFAFEHDKIEKCNNYESWNGRRCDGYCEVSEQCKEMDKGGVL